METENRQNIILETLLPLSDAERIEAKGMAEENTIARYGKRPQLSHFTHLVAKSSFPTWFNYVIAIIIICILLAAANVSAIRVISAGRDHFLAGLKANYSDMSVASLVWQSTSVGVAMFLMAELTVIMSIIAAKVFFENNLLLKGLFYLIAIVGVVIAIVGNAANYAPTLEVSWMGAWSLLETFSPPAIVLAIAFLMERLAMDFVQNKYVQNTAYEEARKQWEKETRHPEQLTGYERSLAEAYKALLIRKNTEKGHGAGLRERIELVRSMTPQEWVIPVQREFYAERVFEVANFSEPPKMAGNAFTKPSGGMHLAPQPVMKQQSKPSTDSTQR